MPQPYDYSINVKDAFNSTMSGFQGGLNLAAYRQKQQDEQLARQRQQEAHDAFDGVYKDPSPENIIRFKSQYPEAVEQYKPALDAMDSQRKQSFVDQSLPIYTAMQSGKTDVAKYLLDTQIDARRNSGMEEEAKHLEMIRGMVDQNPQAAMWMTGSALESAMGSEDFGKHGEEMRKQGLAASAQTKASAEARVAEGTVTAQIAKARAEAKKAGNADFKTIDAGGEIITGYSDAGGNFVETGRIKKTMTPQSQAIYGDSSGGLPDGQSDDDMVKAIGTGQIAPPGSFALRSPRVLRIMNRVVQEYPDFDGGDYAVRLKARRDFATGQEGRMLRSIGTASKHLDMLGELGTALGNNDTQVLNRIGNAFNTQFGGDSATNFNAAKQIVGQEVVKAIVVGGGGVTEREEAAKSISAANSPEQLQGVIDTYRAIMGAQRESLVQQAQALGIPDSELPDYTEGAGPAPLTAQDKQALAWARSNKNDPRAAQILQRLGRQ